MRVFKNLYEYRELLKSNIKKDIRGKYKGSFLGILWSFINPLLQTLVYFIVFPIIMKRDEPNYVTFLICAIIPWNFFTSIIHSGTQCMIGNARILKKVYFPREILPISSVTAGLINFFIQSLVIFLFLILTKVTISAKILFFPLIAIIQYFFILAIVLITSSLQVYIRDLEYIITFIINLAFYASPIFYSAETVAHTKFAWVMKVNPMAILITNYRNVFMYNKMPNFKILGYLFLICIFCCFIGMLVFRKLEKGFAEEL